MDSGDISVTKMEIALRASWNMFHLAGDYRELGSNNDAKSADQCARMAYRSAVDLLPHVMDDASRSILAVAVEQLSVLIRQRI